MDDEPEEMGIPEWVVTFGDMMSLLLTFFIMLVSLSEIKEEETYQALVDSMRQEFGYSKSTASLTPGKARPRTSEMAILSTQGRAKKKNTAKGGVPEKAPTGEDPHVRIIRPGQMTAVGSVVFFELGTHAISSEGAAVLQEVAKQLRGKPQKIEVRGHTSSEFASRTQGTDEAVMLGIRRAIAVRRYLIEKEGLEQSRFRTSSAGESEPMNKTGGSSAIARNSRVEVFLLDETVEDLNGSADERKAETVATESTTENE